jgi:hypothetical protein
MTPVDYYEDKKMSTLWIRNLKKVKSNKWKTIKSESPSEHRVEPKCCSHVPFYYKEHKQGNKLTSSYFKEYKQENELTSL